MKVLILNGAGPENAPSDRQTDQAARILARQLQLDQWETESIILRQKSIRDCVGCFSCWIKTPGQCVIPDDAREIAARAVQAHLLALVTPIVFGQYAYQMKKILDRMIPNILPFFTLIQNEIHHRPRYPRYPDWLVLGIQPHPDSKEENVFRTLVARNALNVHCSSCAMDVFSPDQSETEIDQRIQRTRKSLEAPS